MKPKSAFDDIGKYYDLIYQDKPYQEEASYVLGMLQRLGQNGREVLEFGSGTGRHARLLAAHGLNILGVEKSPAMYAKCAPSPGFRAVMCDARMFDSPMPFDVVLSLFHVLSYQTEDIDLDAIFSSAARNLRPGGHFIFDCWFSPAVRHQGASVRVRRSADTQLEITRISEPLVRVEQNVVDIFFTVFVQYLKDGKITKHTETHAMRHFNILELDRVANAYNLRRCIAEEFITGNAPSVYTWSVCFAYTKIF